MGGEGTSEFSLSKEDCLTGSGNWAMDMIEQTPTLGCNHCKKLIDTSLWDSVVLQL